MARNNKTQIFSVFSQTDEVVARKMVEEAKLTLIPISQIPDTAMFNLLGQRAKFAVIVPREHQAEFERRCADLRA